MTTTIPEPTHYVIRCPEWDGCARGRFHATRENAETSARHADSVCQWTHEVVPVVVYGRGKERYGVPVTQLRVEVGS